VRTAVILSEAGIRISYGKSVDWSALAARSQFTWLLP
jgi:hypothetical protein